MIHFELLDQWNADGCGGEINFWERHHAAGLIGSTGHWQTYAPALGHVPGLTLVAVAAAGPGTPRVVSIMLPVRRWIRIAMTTPGRCSIRSGWMWCRSPAATTGSRSGRTSVWNADYRSWSRSHWRWICPRWKGCSTPRKTKAALVPMHTMRGVPELAAVQKAVRRRHRRTHDGFGPRRPINGARLARTSTAIAQHSPAWHRGSASTPSTGCTGSSVMCSPKCSDEKGRRLARTFRRAPARRSLC